MPIEINITNAQREEIRELAIEFETDAVDTPESSPAYKKYRRYGWLFDFL